ncbi:MAG TPA: hypothetical protein VIO60_06505 [Rectinemataceae bacterium]
MRAQDFLSIRWKDVEGPLIEPPAFSPLIADPSFLFPEESPGGDAHGEWELFAHSAWGIHRYSSRDGLSWRDRGIAVRNAMRPFVRRISLAPDRGSDTDAARSYHLYFESYPPLALALSVLPAKRPWKSRLALSRSENLSRWTRPEPILAPELPWMADPKLGESLSNPCVTPIAPATPGSAGVPDSGTSSHAWRLYYSASLSWIPDCGFCEPRYIGLAESPSPLGPFTPRSAPILDPKADTLPGVLGAGSIKVLPMEDGYIGLQNKIYRDPGGTSRSAIFILRSDDGLSWAPARDAPLLAPASSGWTSSHVYACDCRFREKDGLWYLYFNARDGWRITEGRERIGRMVGKPD